MTGDLDQPRRVLDRRRRWKGKVDFLTEMRDTVGLTLLQLGIDPVDDHRRRSSTQSLAEIQKAVDAGIVRTFTGNDYAEDLVSGNVVLAMAWSGDIIASSRSRRRRSFGARRRGRHALDGQHADPQGRRRTSSTAELMIDFVYDPAIAAQIAAYVNYVSPGQGRQGGARWRSNPELANNPLIFPPADVLAKVKIFKGLDEATRRRT